MGHEGIELFLNFACGEKTRKGTNGGWEEFPSWWVVIGGGPSSFASGGRPSQSKVHCPYLEINSYTSLHPSKSSQTLNFYSSLFEFI